MSLTDDTNCQTIDIPLPDETNSSLPSDACPPPHPEVTNSWTPPTAAPTLIHHNHHNHNTLASHQISQQKTSAMTVNPYANPSLQQSYQSYYSYYSSAYQQIPQMMSQTYPYFMPIMRPMVPTVSMVPQFQSIAPQMPSVVNATNSLMNSQTIAEDNEDYDDEDDDDSDPTVARGPTKASNILPIHCNEKMGLNPLIFQNIQQSPYFKNNLFQLKTYHEVIDEIFYSVKHLEPWEKGSRKVGGQTGMCGSVRGVGAGGIISTPFCILYKLFTLKLTRKQVNGLIRHKDSPYIRALGFMYIRFTQPPQHLFNWFEPFLEDEEEVDPKAGGGQPMTIGQMSRHMLSKLDWFSTLFPRVPVPIQKEIESKLRKRDAEYEQQMREEKGIEDGEVEEEEEEEQVVEEPEVKRQSGDSGRGRHEKSERRHSRERKRSRSRDKERGSRTSDDKHRHRRSRSPHTHRHNRNEYRTDKSERCEHKRKHR